MGERLGLAFDGQRGELHGTFGCVTLRVAVETRPDGTLATVAHLAWPSLDMRLSVARSVLNSLFPVHGVETGEARFDRLFHAQGRFPEQVRALLGAEVRALLVAPPDAEVNDEGATLCTPRALVDEDPLAELAEGAMELARAFDAAFARVPLPPRLAAVDEAWRDLAARLGGRVTAGSGAIHEGTLGLDRVEIDVVWADDGALLATEVSIPLDARVDLATLSPAARAQAASLEQITGGRVEITREAVTLTFDHRALPAPRALEDALDGLSGLAQSVRRRAGASPFRS